MIDSRTAPYAALVLRVALGTMFLAHGLLKLVVFTLPGTAQFFVSVGFPGWLAYPVTGAELIAGSLLVLGIAVRPVAAVMALELLAAATVHFGNGWFFAAPNGGWEYPIFLVIVAIGVALLGEGAYALRMNRIKSAAQAKA